MYDLDGNGKLESHEFETVLAVVTKRGRSAKHSRKEMNALSKKFRSSYIMQKLFGQKSNQKLDFATFARFVSDLKQDVSKLEYEWHAGKNGAVTLQGFAEILCSYAKESRTAEYLQRASAVTSQAILPLEQWHGFSELLDSVDELEDALGIYCAGNSGVNKSTFQRATKVITGRPFDPAMVDVIFTVFDTDGDGTLSYQEFTHVLKDHAAMSLKQQHRDLGVWRGLSGLTKCVREKMEQ